MAQDQRKAELTAELAHARSRIAGNFGALRHDLDLPARLKSAVLRKPVAWIGGATLFGVLLSKLPARRKKVIDHGGGAKEAKMVTAGKTGLFLGALKIAFDLSRPAIIRWAGKRVSDYLDGTRNDQRFPR